MPHSPTSLIIVKIEPGSAFPAHLFSHSELSSLSRYKTEEGRLSQAASRLLKRVYLQKIPFTHNEFGKIILEGKEFVSLTHCFPYIAMTLSTQEIGLDLVNEESFEPNLEKVCFAKQELLSAMDPSTRWALKEAAYKIWGDHPFEPSQEPVFLRKEPGEANYRQSKIYFLEVPFPDHHLLVASPHPLGKIETTFLSLAELVQKAALAPALDVKE